MTPPPRLVPDRPSDYVLVPREPAEEMIDAAYVYDSGTPTAEERDNLKTDYRLMIAAAIGEAFLAYFDGSWAMYPSDGSELFNDVLRRARELDDPRPADAGWRPIAEAPEEGTFLVYLANPMLGSHVHAARWHPNVKTIGAAFHFDAPKPTHWAPLPAAPAPTAEEGDGNG